MLTREKGIIAFIFPGQGSQYPGMGKEFYDNWEVVREVFERANQVLGFSLSELCFEKDERRSFERLKHWVESIGDKLHLEFIHRLMADGQSLLKQTRYSQPTVFTTSVACFEVFKQELRSRSLNLDAVVTAGHSLGEYTSLVAAGAIDFEDGLRLVKARGEYMQECGERIGNAGLVAVVNKEKSGSISDEHIQKLTEADVRVALYNTDSQIVIAGYDKNLKRAMHVAKGLGLQAIPLKVSGPFHTPLMKPAADKLREYLEGFQFSLARIPIIANVSTYGIVDPVHIKEELVKQIYTPILWKQSVQKMIQSGVRVFIEIGPGKVLSNMIKRSHSEVEVLNVEDEASLEATLKRLTRLMRGSD